MHPKYILKKLSCSRVPWIAGYTARTNPPVPPWALFAPCFVLIFRKINDRELPLLPVIVRKEQAMPNISVYAFVALGFFLAAPPQAGADVRLEGKVGPVTIDDNVVIARDTTAALNGTIIKGNVKVRRGATLITRGARIDGNVQAAGSLLVDLRQKTFVDGDVQGERTRSVLVRGGTVVGGNIQIKEAAAPVDVDALFVRTARVDGDVQVEKSAGRLRVLDTFIGGNLQFVENLTGPYRIRDNRIAGDLQFFKNRGKGTITGNHVRGNLQSKENKPRPVIKDNIVEGDLEIE